MKPLTFDLGSTIGWANRDLAGNVIAGHRHFDGPRAHRAADTLAHVEEVIRHAKAFWDIDVVVYETPFARGRDATRCLWGIAGLVEAAATSCKLPVLDVAVATIKKFATGDGKASKVQMIDAARKLGYRGSSDHEADAVCLMAYAEKNLERAGR